jgi:hypothetical protein
MVFAFNTTMMVNQPCWIQIASGALRESRLIFISETHATILLPDKTALLPLCNLLFRADGKVG